MCYYRLFRLLNMVKCEIVFDLFRINIEQTKEKDN